MTTTEAGPAIGPEIVAQHGLTPGEYKRACAIMGRTPNLTELGIFSVMWSEHCSYKSSKVWLRRLPTTEKLRQQRAARSSIRRSRRRWHPKKR